MVEETLKKFLVKNNTDKYTKRNPIMLVSCLFYLIPAFYIYFTKLRKNNFLFFISFLQVILSILSDYYFINHVDGPKLWKLDRSVAVLFSLYMFYLVYNINDVIPFILMSICLFAIEYARSSKNNDVWIKRHCIWHFISSTILMYGLYTINNEK
tara:strand:- start:11 stop:472 length:462 start_codon:yes stop_codon:yes gene_type:complete